MNGLALMIGILTRGNMKKELTVLDLFSGIGGFSLGLESAGFSTIAFCEIEPFCQKVLSKHWPQIPIAKDIRNLSYKNGKLYDAERVVYEGKIDLICGGFPCQPFSVAGRKKGTSDHRDLWPEMFRIIQEVQPTWIVGENVANFINMAFTRTKVDLESEGYRLQPLVIPACAVGAPHRRDRIWIIAYSENKRCGGWRENGNGEISEQQICEGEQDHGNKIRGEAIAGDELCSSTSHCNSERCNSGSNNRTERSILHDENWNAEEAERQRHGRKRRLSKAGDTSANHGGERTQGRMSGPLFGQQAFSWCKDVRRIEDYFNRPDIPKPLICRSDNGFSTRVDRLRALGNAVVPQIPEAIGHAIINSIKG